MIRIVTDSSSDITPQRAKELGIDVLALSVNFGEESFKSGTEMTNEQFYERLVDAKVMPTTAQVNPYEFEECYRKYIDQGDEIISIHMSAGLSGTYQSAVIAKESIGTDKIRVIDSETVCSSVGLLAILAKQMVDEGKDFQTIGDTIQEYVGRLQLYIILDTLDYLKRGGRISPSVAFVGGVLGLHPVVSVVNQTVKMLDKVKGKKSANRWLVSKMQEIPQDKSLPMLIGHANAFEKGEKLREELEASGVTGIMDDVCMGPIIGTHGGPDAIGIFYIAEKK